MKFNHKLFKKEREKIGLSFGKFAEALKPFGPKASKTIVWSWENGIRQPSVRYLKGICAILEKDENFFYK